MRIHFFIALTLSVFLSRAAVAADIESGPKVGEKVPALKVHSVVGEHEGKEVDFAGDRKGKTTVYVFIYADKWDRPTARYLKGLDKAASDAGKDAYVVAVWLSEDQDKSKEYLPKAQQSLKFSTTALTVAVDGKNGPSDWIINDRAHVTTVVAKDGKVSARFAYQSLNETDLPEVEKAMK